MNNANNTARYMLSFRCLPVKTWGARAGWDDVYTTMAEAQAAKKRAEEKMSGYSVRVVRAD